MSFSINNISSIYQIYQVQTQNTTTNSFATSNYTGAVQNTFNNPISKSDTTYLRNISNSMKELYTTSRTISNASGKDETEDTVKTHVENFVKSYNTGVDALAERKDTNTASKKLYNSLTEIATSQKEGLAAMGITIESGGKLTIDEKRLTEAIGEEQIKVTDTLKALTSKTDKVALNGMMTTSADLLAGKTTHSLQDWTSEEEYAAGVRKMASNMQFMNFYYATQTAINMLL